MLILDKLAVNLRNQMVSANVSKPPSADVLRYAMEIVANTVSIVGLSLIVAAFTGHLADAAVVIVFFGTIRFLSGGYHLQSGLRCVIVSTTIITALSMVSLSQPTTLAITGIALVVMAWKAPANYDKYARISRRYYPVMKAAACAVVASNFVVMSDILAITYITQAALLFITNKGANEE